MKDWEALGYQLLPEKKEDLVEVRSNLYSCIYLHCNCLANTCSYSEDVVMYEKLLNVISYNPW